MNHPRRLIQSELKHTRGETGELERISIASPLGVQGIKARFEQLDNVASKTKVEVSRDTIRGGVVICPTAAVLPRPSSLANNPLKRPRKDCERQKKAQEAWGERERDYPIRPRCCQLASWHNQAYVVYLEFPVFLSTIPKARADLRTLIGSIRGGG
jgi:hypothetical protein